MVVSLSHYELLGLKPNVTEDEIKDALRIMSRALHPDKNPQGKCLMQQINIAKDILLDASKRAAYDSGELCHHNGKSSSFAETLQLRSQLAAAQQELASLRQTNGNLMSTVHTLENERNQTRMKYATMERKYEQLEGKHKMIKTQNVNLHAANEKLQVENQEQARQIETYVDKVDRISRELRENRERSSELKMLLTTEREQSDENMHQLQEKYNGVEEQNIKLQAAKEFLEKETLDQARQVDIYEEKLERIRRSPW